VNRGREDNEVAELRGQGQEIQTMSKLHQGFLDWIFVKPSGAFVEGQLSGQFSDQSSA